VNYRRTQS